MVELSDILAGKPRAVARAITAAENASAKASDLLAGLYPHTGKALVVGITGAPGAGKSTLVDRLAVHFRSEGHRVGIIAVDPSSPFSGGAILGDRIRMKHLVTDPGVFIRSMATRGALGGLSRATADAVAVLDAAGYERIIVETVGVGQDEVDIVKTADVSVVVLVPGMGDDIQAIKAGIMEIGDVFAINKADREGVLRTEKELEALLTTGHREDMWNPPVVKTVATADTGTADLAAAVYSYKEFLDSHDEQRRERRVRTAEQRIVDLLRERLVRDALERLGVDELKRLTTAVADRELDPYSAVDQILVCNPDTRNSKVTRIGYVDPTELTQDTRSWYFPGSHVTVYSTESDEKLFTLVMHSEAEFNEIVSFYKEAMGDAVDISDVRDETSRTMTLRGEERIVSVVDESGLGPKQIVVSNNIAEWPDDDDGLQRDA